MQFFRAHQLYNQPDLFVKKRIARGTGAAQGSKSPCASAQATASAREVQGAMRI